MQEIDILETVKWGFWVLGIGIEECKFDIVNIKEYLLETIGLTLEDNSVHYLLKQMVDSWMMDFYVECLIQEWISWFLGFQRFKNSLYF